MSEIRTASYGDLARCAGLLEILFSQEEEFSADARAQTRGLEMIIRNPDLGRIFVCEREGSIQAMVLLLFTVSTFLGRKAALLEDMVVAPEWRGKGIGSMLIDHALDFAQREGFGRITLLTDHDNVAAQQFYRSKGFARSEMVVFRKLLDVEKIGGSEMDAWMCRECGYLYDPAEGDPESGIRSGTPFHQVCGEWACPVCYTGKENFECLNE